MNDFNSQPDETTVQNKKNSFNPSGHTQWLSSLSIVLAAISLGIALWCYSEYKTVKNDAHDAQISNTVQQQTAQSQLEQLQTNLVATQQNMTTLMQRIESGQQQTVLSQIAYLINLANLQLNISHNTQASLRLLILAEKKLDDLNDPRLFALSRILNKNIAELKVIPFSPITEIISEIDMLSDAIDHATLMPNQKDLNKTEKKSAADVAEPDTNQNDKWYVRAWHHFSGIKDLIIIRKSNPDIRPLLDTEQQAMIKSTLQSKLLLAEYAAVQNNNALFQNHLAMLKKWIKKYFFESVDRENLLKQLKLIESNNVSPPIPDISETIAILNQTLSALTDSIAAPTLAPTVATPPAHFLHELPQQPAPPHATPVAPAKNKKSIPDTNTPPVNSNTGVAI